jgi:mono/diheme cytochrome c family protein
MSRRSVGVLAATLMMTSVVATTRVQPPRQQTPAPLILGSIAGRDSFDFYCAPCHGKTGKGDGPVAPALKSRPVDLTALARQNGGVFPRDRVVAALTGIGRPLMAHGSSQMPVWGPIFRGLDPSDARVLQRIDNVVAYVETLQATTVHSTDQGASLFRTHCAACHGATARGDGPAAGRFLKPPPDLTKYTASAPAHGSREMPVWGDLFKRSGDGSNDAQVKARIEAIVRYLRAIQERAT